MKTKRFAILGATGHVGYALATELLGKKHQVVAIGRNQDRLADLKKKGADTHVCQFNDVEGMSRAFTGADAIFSMLPPAYMEKNFTEFHDTVSKAIIEAMRQAKIHHVVNLSSVGAQNAHGMGPINGLHKHEARLDKNKALNIVHLRPTFFMENFLWDLEAIEKTGAMAGAFKKNVQIPLVATQDIAHKAAEILEKFNFQGHSVVEFTGPDSLTMEQVAEIIGKSIGKSARYQ